MRLAAALEKKTRAVVGSTKISGIGIWSSTVCSHRSCSARCAASPSASAFAASARSRASVSSVWSLMTSATCSTLPDEPNSGSSVIETETRRPSVTCTCCSSRGSYQKVGVCTVSPANARLTSPSSPCRSAISSCSTLYSGGGSDPNRSRNALLVSRQWPSARYTCSPNGA